MPLFVHYILVGEQEVYKYGNHCKIDHRGM